MQPFKMLHLCCNPMPTDNDLKSAGDFLLTLVSIGSGQREQVFALC